MEDKVEDRGSLIALEKDRIAMENTIQTNLKELFNGEETGFFIEFVSAELLNNFTSGYVVVNGNRVKIEPPILGHFDGQVEVEGMANLKRLDNPILDFFLEEIENTLQRFKDEFLNNKIFKNLAQEIVERVWGPSPLDKVEDSGKGSLIALDKEKMEDKVEDRGSLTALEKDRIAMENTVQKKLKELFNGEETGFYIEFVSAELLNNFKSGYVVDSNGNAHRMLIEPHMLGYFVGGVVGISNWKRIENPVLDYLLEEIANTIRRFKDEFFNSKIFKNLVQEIVQRVWGPSPLLEKQECVSNTCGSTAKWAKAVVENSEKYADKNAAAAYLQGNMGREMLEKNILPIVYLKLQTAKIHVAIGETERAEALIKEVEEDVDWNFTEGCLQSFKSAKEMLKRHKEMEVASCSTTSADANEVESPFFHATRDIRGRKSAFKF